MKWFTADTHFGHQNIAGPDVSNWNNGYRNFKDVNHMDGELLKQINACVAPDDELYHLGDFSWHKGGKAARIRAMRYYLDIIDCKNVHLILGNHDDRKAIQAMALDSSSPASFASVQEVLEIKIMNTRCYMSHYGHRVWPNSHRGAFHLYGHSHGNLPSYGRSMDVGVDSIYNLMGEYSPISEEEVFRILINQHVEYPDHHNLSTNP